MSDEQSHDEVSGPDAPADEVPTEVVTIEQGDAEAPDESVDSPPAARKPWIVAGAIGASVALLAAGTGVTLALTGAGSPTAPAPSSSPSVTVPDPDDASSAPLVSPRGVFGLSCDQLVSPSLAERVFGTPMRVTADNVPFDWSSAAMASVGGIDCSWNGADDSHGQDRLPSLGIAVLPGAAAEAYIWQEDDAYSVVDTAGDDSYFSCSDWGGERGCFGTMTVRDAWVEVGFTIDDDPDRDEMDARAQSVFASIARAIDASSTAANPWTPTAEPLGPQLCPDSRASDEVKAAFRLELETYGTDAYSSQTFHLYETLEPSWCLMAGPGEYGTRKQVNIYALPGGGWSVGAADSWRGYTEVFDLDVQGADEARVACAADRCSAAVRVGTNAYWFSTHRIDQGELVAALNRLFAEAATPAA